MHGIREITDRQMRTAIYHPMADTIRKGREWQFLTDAVEKVLEVSVIR